MKLWILLLSVSLFAHNLWIKKEDNGFKLFYGHLHFGKNSIEKRAIKYDPKKVKYIICKNRNEIKNIDFVKKYPIVVKKECEEVYIFMDNGFFTKTPYGIKNLPKNRVKMPLYSFRSFKSVKYLNKNSKKAITNSLEIVLLNDPKRIADEARLLILFNKKPISGAVVTYDSKSSGITSQDGRINLKVKRAGVQNISATIKRKCKSNECDKIRYSTTLNFEIEK